MRWAVAAVAARAAALVLLCAAAGPQPPGGGGADAESDPTPAPSWPNNWVQRGAAQVAALDKVSAQLTPVTIRVGESVPYHTLTIAVRACVARPPDQPADAAAWLDVTDSRPGNPEFHGWMLAREPGLSVLQSPSYDVRLLGCR